MKRWLLVLAACGGSNAPDSTDLVLLDSSHIPMDQTVIVDDFCNLATQFGCSGKCTWIHATDDSPDGTPGLGATGCEPNGTAKLGEACAFAPVAQGGYDNCVSGTICLKGTCEQICFTDGEAPGCPSGRACVAHSGLLANVGDVLMRFGVCDISCDPLADNDFDGSGTRFTKTGTACGSDPTVGCYGYPTTAHPTTFTCAAPYPGTEQLAHRSLVPTSAYDVNACMPGYEIGTLYDDSGALTVDCLAWCSPGDAYLGNPTANAPNGVAPHRCNTEDALGAFGTPASDTANGEHCTYSWLFEVDEQHLLHRSPTSDTLGICIDHTKYRYDSDGDGTFDTTWPACATLPLSMAGLFGCVSSAFAQPKAYRHFIQLPELR